MDPLGSLLTTRPNQMGWEFTIEPYLSWQFGFIDIPDSQFGNCSGSTWTLTQSDGPEPLVSLFPLHHVITVYNDMFDHMNGIMRALAKKKTQWKEDLYFAVKFEHQMLSKYYAEVTLTTCLLLISAHILDPFQELQLFRKWDKGMDNNDEDETSYTTHNQEAFLKYMENEYCARHWLLSFLKLESVRHSNLFSRIMASRLGQTSHAPYDFSSDDEEYLMPENMAETTPGRSHCAASLITATRLYLNSLPELPHKWGQVNPNHNDYLSDAMESSSTFWIQDITDWWHQQKQMHLQYANLSSVARDILSPIPHGICREASYSIGRDVISWMHSKTTGEALCEKQLVRQFTQANNGILAGDDLAMDTRNAENDLEMKREAEERKLHRMAKVHNVLEKWQGSQNQRATRKESHPQNNQMTAVGHIPDTEEIVKQSWSYFRHDGAAAFKLLERSRLPPALSAKYFPGGWTQVLNVRRISRIHRHPVESDEDSTPDSISDSENWLNRNGDFDNPTDTEDDWDADTELDIDLQNGVDDPEGPELWDLSAAKNVPGLIRSTQRSKKIAGTALMIVSTMETRRNKGNKK